MFSWLGKIYIAGNVYKENFLGIRTGKRLINARKFLIDANRGFSIYNVCDVYGLIMSNNQAKSWSDLINNG